MRPCIGATITIAFCLLNAELGWCQEQTRAQRGGLSAPQRTEIPEGGVVVPMKSRGGMPVVEVRINGQGPFLLAVDTGGMGTARADETLVAKLKLPVAGKVQASDGSGRNPIELDVVEIESLSIDTARFTGLQAPSRNYNRSQSLEHVDGILGMHLFSECLVTLDYPRKLVRIEQGELPPADDQEILSLDATTPIPAVPIRIGKQTVMAHIDSGNMAGGLILPPAIADKLKFSGKPVTVGEGRTVTNRLSIQQAKLVPSVFLGRHEVRSPLVSIVDLGTRANLGSEWLQHFAVTIDLKNQRIRFAREQQGPIQLSPRYYVGIAFNQKGDELTVDRVIAGSPAEKAGLLGGDSIIAINGKQKADVSPSQMRKYFASPNPVELTVRRAGELLELTVTPERAAK